MKLEVPSRAGGGALHAEPDVPSLIESARPISQSRLWRLSDDFYAAHGREVWSRNLIPETVTTNAYIANAYAAMIDAFFRDLRRGGIDAPPLILELGAGSGRLGWGVIQRLLHTYLPHHERAPDFTYCMTDGARSNVDAWCGHKRLAALLDEPFFDIGTLWLEAQPVIHSRKAGPLRLADLGDRPLVVIANYLYCSIPCDIYRVRDHALHVEHVALHRCAPRHEGEGPFHTIDARYTSQPCPDRPTGLALVDDAIERYRQRDGDFRFPVSVPTLAFTDALLRRDAPFLGLSGDLGYTDPAQFPSHNPLILRNYLAHYTNHHLMAEIVRAHGGQAQAPVHADPSFSVCALWREAAGVELEQTARQARTTLAEFSPDDAHEIAKALRYNRDAMPTGQILSWLRFVRFDPWLTRKAMRTLATRLDDRRLNPLHVRDMLLEAYRLYLPMGEEAPDFDVEIAHLLLQLKLPRDALALLERGKAEFGESPGRLHEEALTRYVLEDYAGGHVAGERCLALDPERVFTRQMMETFEEARHRRPSESAAA